MNINYSNNVVKFFFEELGNDVDEGKLYDSSCILKQLEREKSRA